MSISLATRGMISGVGRAKVYIIHETPFSTEVDDPTELVIVSDEDVGEVITTEDDAVVVTAFDESTQDTVVTEDSDDLGYLVVVEDV